MWVPLNLSRVDIYINEGACGQWRHEKKILPLEFSENIRFYPYNQPETNLSILYKHSTDTEIKVKKRKILKGNLVTNRMYTDKKRLKQATLCFLLSVKKEWTFISFKVSQCSKRLVNSSLTNCSHQFLLSMVIEVIQQVKLNIDHHFLSYSLSQRLRPVILPIQGSTRNKIICWFHHHFSRYMRKGLQLEGKGKLEKDGSLSFLNWPSSDFQDKAYQEPHWSHSHRIDQRLMRQVCLTTLSQDINLKSNYVWLQERFFTYEEEKDLNLTIIMTSLKKIATGELKDVLDPSSVYPMLIKMWLTNDQSDGLLEAFKTDPIFVNFPKIFQILTNRILDAFSRYTIDKEELDLLALDIITSMQIIRKLIMMTNVPENLKSEEGSHRLIETVKPSVRLSFSLFYDVYDSLYSLTAEPDVGNDFRNHDYYSSYLRAVRYPLMKRLGDQDPPLKPEEKAIFTFLEGKKKVNELGITDQNARMMLTTIKIIDQAMKNYSVMCEKTSYRLRQLILQVSGCEMTTYEVYTTSPNPANYTNFEHLTHPKSWMNERVARQAKLIIDHNILSRFLSQRMKPIVIATRGNTGAGKSFWIHHFLKDYLEENAQLSQGVLNPDIIKAGLKRILDRNLLNSQVYIEGRIIFEKLLDMLTKYVNKMTSAVIDTRLLTIEEFNQVLALTKLRGVQLELLDVDAPIWNSVISVLNREPFGKDPCVPFEVIKDGFTRAKQYRRAFIEACCKENIHYSLYQVNQDGQFELVAEARNHEFKQYSEKFQECLIFPSQVKIDAIGFTQITEQWINSLPSNKKKAVEQWKGYTVREALFKHSQGERP